MQKRFLSAVVLALLPVMTAGCGYSIADAAEDVAESGDAMDGSKAITADWMETGTFTALSTRGPDNVIFKIGEKFVIKAEGDADTLDKLRFKIDGNAIVIGRADTKWYKAGSKAATIYVTAPSLSAIALAGSGNVKADRIESDTVTLSAAGSGDIDIAQVVAKTLNADLAGSGNIRAAGRAATASYSVAGSGDLDGRGVATTDASVSVAGSGDVSVNATGTVDASIAGTGDVAVTGGAKCTSSVVGTGNVTCG